MGGEAFQWRDMTDCCNLEGFLEEVETCRIGVTGLGTSQCRNPVSQGKSEFMQRAGDWLMWSL